MIAQRLAAAAVALGCVTLAVWEGGGPGYFWDASFAWDGPGRALVIVAAVSVAAAALVFATGRPAAGELTGLASAAGAGALAILASLSLAVDQVALLWGAAWILASVSAAAGGPARLEPAIKMAGLGGAAALTLLLGAALLAALAGSTHLLEIGYAALGLPESPLLARAALRIYLVGLAACAAWVPFHFWAPDGLSGTGGLRAAVLGVVFPLAAVLCLARATYALEPTLAAAGVGFGGGIYAISLLTVGYAGSVALVQQDAGRLLAYLTVARAGECLAAAVSGPRPEGQLAGAFVAHASAVAPAWLALAVLAMERRGTTEGEELRFTALRGWGRRAPGRAAVLGLAAALAAGAPGSALFLWRPSAALGTGSPQSWGLLLALSAALQWAAVVRLVRVLLLEEPEGAAPPPEERRLARLWWALAAVLAVQMALSFSSRLLAPLGAAWSTLLPGI